jgi:hypothetical protein
MMEHDIDRWLNEGGRDITLPRHDAREREQHTDARQRNGQRNDRRRGRIALNDRTA